MCSRSRKANTDCPAEIIDDRSESVDDTVSDHMVDDVAAHLVVHPCLVVSEQCPVDHLVVDESSPLERTVVCCAASARFFIGVEYPDKTFDDVHGNQREEKFS